MPNMIFAQQGQDKGTLQSLQMSLMMSLAKVEGLPFMTLLMALSKASSGFGE